ncbi:MAG: DUF1553 domain-containing protein [Planctomycetaceae bacterium]|nr:DUF1553 domain-containing protein [Planctomycetaceae bacterium]
MSAVAERVIHAARTIAACVLFLLPAGAVAADEHWSFRPVVRPQPPVVRDPARPSNAIDTFILARLEAEGIAPSPPTDRVTLIRRITLDLIGLPPTPDEVEAFANDEHPDACERLVDRLLASPHYGERWARPWLDLCHYGDSDGHLTDQLRPVAWRYRDWVVRGLNENLPFDQFTIRQIAGDLLPDATLDDVMGTGFLRQTLSNREGGADLEEYRVAQIIDRTSMTGTIWLGLTIGCARCHDHKYDSVTQDDFFRLYAFFDNADEVNIDAPLPDERAAWLASQPEYERRRALLRANVASPLRELQQRWETKCLDAAAHPGVDHVWDRQWELLGLIWGGHFGEGQLEGTQIARLPIEKRSPRQHADLEDYFLKHGSIVDSKAFDDAKLGEIRDQLAALRKEFPQATRAPVMQAALNPRQTYIHERGDFRARGADVEPDTPAALPAPAEHADSTRLALARWLVAPQNPLTSRVTVNRMWQEFFGRGLVLTSNDFGRRGDRPSHPELLDWLAAEFQDSGWDVKHMHRLIVTSAAYRQSSQPRDDLRVRDAENVLVARQASLRVPAETVRDLALATSGLLSRKVGGPGVRPPQSERVTMEAFGENDWKVSDGDDRYRRGLYTFLLRTAPFAQAIIFDAPTPNDVCTRRPRSNTPLQALTLLNDPAFFEMAQGLALRLLAQPGKSDDDRVAKGLRICLARSPGADEIKRLSEYLQQQRVLLSADAARAELIAPATQPPVAVTPAELAAWTNLSSVLLNLHEFITRD